MTRTTKLLFGFTLLSFHLNAIVINVQDASTLTIGPVNTASTDTITLFDTSTLVIDLNTKADLNATVNGPSTSFLQKTGTATLDIVQDKLGFAGNVALNQGSMVVTASLGNAALTTVASGTLLSGTGTVSNLAVSGTVAPGTPLGTLTNNGNVTIQPGGALEITVSPTTLSELAITGAFTALSDANLDVVFNSPPASYSPQVYPTPFVQTASGITGSLATQGSLPGFGIVQVQIGNALYLQLTRSSLFNTSGLTGNALALANYMNGLSSNYAVIESLINSLNTLPNIHSALSSISPARNAFTTFAAQNTMFAFSNLVTHAISSKRFAYIWGQLSNSDEVASSTEEVPFKENELLAQNEGLELSSPSEYLGNREPSDADYGYYNMPAGDAIRMARGCDNFMIRLDGFGQFAHQRAQSQTPSFGVQSGGALLSFDYFGFNYCLVGCAAGYAHNAIYDKHNGGNGTTELYTGALYGTGYYKGFYFEAAVWGTFDQFKNKRKIHYPGFSATASSSHNGAQVMPHIDLGYDFCFDGGVLEPFVGFDWVFNFQQRFSEKGAGIYDMKQRSSKSSMLRSEIGLAGYQVKTRCCGTFIFKEYLSYVNKKPFSIGKIQAAFVGYPGSFTVESFTSCQNLVAPAVEIFFRANNGIFSSVSYEGEFGSHYWSNEVVGEIGMYF